MLEKKSPLFFCAIGGSGMLPLAIMMKARGADVRGSDRSRDQGRTPERFAYIEKQGLKLFPQDGSGVTDDLACLIVSSAVEKTVPDYETARKKNIPIVHRAQLLAEIFNAAKTGIAVAGTSGKSTTTGMIGWILHVCGLRPSVVNGAAMKNFVSKDAPFASALAGDPDLFVAEADESDGSIALYNPRVAVINNISLDHKSMDELRDLFGAFAAKADTAILNLDNAETAVLARKRKANALTYSLRDEKADLFAANLAFRADGASFDVRRTKTNETASVDLCMPGAHNISNALAAIAAAMAAGVSFKDAAKALESFEGIARRLDVVGRANDVTVIDDFAHNPDKIAATLACLHQFGGRLLILFQPHGYGPLKLMKTELANAFASNLSGKDLLFLPDPLYLGGTTDKSVGSAELAALIGAKARYIPAREDCAAELLKEVRPGDRAIVMGARDDTLPALAKNLLNGIKSFKNNI